MRNLLFVFLLIGVSSFAQTRYVSVAGGGDGTSTGSTWTLAQGFANATAGMTVYIQAGDYGNGSYVQTTNATSASPIQFIGTDASWTPIVAGTYATYYNPNEKPSEGQTYNESPFPTDGTDMPYLENVAADNRNTGTAINIQGDHVFLKNFAIRGYSIGVEHNWRCNGGGLENINTFRQGNFNIDDSFENCVTTGGSNCPSAFLNYDGFGIWALGDNATVEKCFVFNAGAEGIRLRYGNGQTHRNNVVVSTNENINNTDYYYQISDVDGGLVRGSTVWRQKGSRHVGHGFSFKKNTLNIVVDSSYAVDINYELQLPSTQNNTISNSFSIDGRITLTNGANLNTIDSHTFTGADSRGVVFNDWQDGNAEDPSAAGYQNLIINSKFLGGESGVDFGWYSTAWDGSADDNTFINCTFDGLDALFTQDRPNNNTSFINCSFSNIPTLVAPPTFSTRHFPIDISYDHCNFFGNGFTTPTTGSFSLTNSGTSTITATNITTGDPVFTADFYPNTGSALIDAGVTDARAAIDFEGNSRPFGSAYDIGAVENVGAVSDVTAPTVSNVSVIENNSTYFRLEWNVNEGSKGQIRYGTSSGVYTESTTLEEGFLTYHVQKVGGNNGPDLLPGTTYYYVIDTEDMAGNTGTSAEFTNTTLTESGADPNIDIFDFRALFLKLKKL